MINIERKCDICGSYYKCGGVDAFELVYVCGLCSLRLSTVDLFELTRHENQVNDLEELKMVYEEKLIDGVLCYRTDPEKWWKRVPLEQITKRMLEAESLRDKVEATLKNLRSDLVDESYDVDYPELTGRYLRLEYVLSKLDDSFVKLGLSNKDRV